MFLQQFEQLVHSTTPPTSQYFNRVWKNCCPQFKVMRSQRFSICDEGHRIKVNLNGAILKGLSTKDIKTQRKNHLEFIFRQRLEYQMKKDRARLHSSNSCSIIIDGADESAFGLPHFTTKTKSQCGHMMKFKVVGLLEHRIVNKLTLLTMTEEHATGANHVVEVVHRYINAKSKEGPLPCRFYVQLDNCSRENKNRYLLSYLEMLVALGTF